MVHDRDESEISDVDLKRHHMICVVLVLIGCKAVILFDEQRTAISLKWAVPLFLAQIVILFTRIGEQFAEIALFLFSIRFGRSRIDKQRGLFVPHETNKRIEEQRFPPFLHHSAHFN